MATRAVTLVALLAIGAQLAYLHFQGAHPSSIEGAADDDDDNPPPITCNVLGHDDAVQRFSQLLKFPTVSNDKAELHIPLDSRQHFHDLLDYLPTAYPAVWSACEVEMVGAGQYSVLIKWQGSDPSLLPLLFISHYDVVPVTKATEKDWEHGPFSGAIADGAVWGRGALDIKFSVAALLETLSLLIQDGFVPQRTIYVTFGHDEEVSGMLGAHRVSELLRQRGIEFEVIVDEGGTILSDGIKPITSQPVGVVGTSERVYSMVRVTVNATGGHSSMPPTDGSDVATQIGKLLLYVHAHPFPAALRPPFSELLRTMSKHADRPLVQYVLQRSHLWPLDRLIPLACTSAPTVAAQVRTTVAAVRLGAGIADNVLPQQGHVVFNVRSHPLDTTHEQVLAYFNEAIRKTGVSAHAEMAVGSFEGQRPIVTSSSGPHFRALKRAIQETWRHDGKGIAVTPMLMTGGTDSKHFNALTRHGVLRFTPYQLNQSAGDLGRIHGTNERVSAADFKRALCTYRRLVQLLSKADMTQFDEVL